MKTPLHLWIVGVVSLIWNAGGSYDYLMTQLKNETYLAMLTAPQRAFIDGVPVWFEASWAIGIWFSVLGSILLLCRSRLARTSFGFSFLGLAVSAVYSYGIASPSSLETSGTAALAFSAVIAVVLILLYFYARTMTQRGVLR